MRLCGVGEMRAVILKAWRRLVRDARRYGAAGSNDTHGPQESISPVRIALLLLLHPGLRASLHLRAIECATEIGAYRVALLIRGRCLRVVGADFVPGLRVGAGVKMEHPSGIVIGGQSHVGDDVTILQQVTIGDRLQSLGRGFETASLVTLIGDRVEIGAGARLLGSICVGRGARIGANAVVLTDVPDESSAVGVPARIIPGGN